METILNLKVEGDKQLHGSITTNSSKNGAVVLLCASLLTKGTTRLKHMPKIEEVRRIIEVLQSIGVTVTWEKRDVVLTPPKTLALKSIDKNAAKKTRSILLLLGPLIHHTRSFSLPKSGGCKLGIRTVRPHFYALEALGVSMRTSKTQYSARHRGLSKNKTLILYESGDTVTENAIMAAARISGTTTIKYASANYQVQELCFFLEKLGVRIDGIGTTTLVVHGKPASKRHVTYTVSEDPTDSMLFLAVAAVTRSSITIKRCPIDFLELELLTLKHMGFRYEITRQYKARNGRTNLVDIKTHSSHLIGAGEKIHPRPYPGLNMDNLPFFAVIATQARGTTLIHDWVYEKRAIYYTDLDKLGADTLLADPHRIFITGPTKLQGAELICPPALRPATILLIGMLAARGTSVLRNIYSINRGYEDLPHKLKSLGARIEFFEFLSHERF